MNEYHERAAQHKALRALGAIEHIAAYYMIPSSDLPDILTRGDALRYLRRIMFADSADLIEESVAWWSATAFAEAWLASPTGCRMEDVPIYDTSRRFIEAGLDVRIAAAESSDPFEGLMG